jgi:hypothetical protein
MKKSLFLLLMTLPVLAAAGPEDYVPKATYTATSVVPYYLQTLIFDAATLSDDQQTLKLEARYGNFIGDFPVLKTTRQTEDRAEITAQKIILNKWNANCGEGEFATATVGARSRAIYGIDPRALTITVKYLSTPNTCGGAVTKTLIQYELVE